MNFWVLAAFLWTSVHALIPLEIKGNRFFQNGTEFTIVGIDYQPGGSSAFQINGNSDVLTDENQCLALAYILQTYLPQVNVIRVYSINPWLNHDKCMSILNGIGVYLLLDVNNPYQALSRTNPKSSYNEAYLNNVFGIIDAFKGYPNLLGFFAGNEVINDDTSASVDPTYIRAVQRDMKQYIAKHADRIIPVGYSAADVVDLRAVTFEYLQCNISSTDDSRADFFGLNSYEWCSGVNNWQSSGYQELLDDFSNSTIPVFLSEFGCNTKTPRTFDEVDGGVYADLLESLSGGLVYEFSNEANDYGLVDIDNTSISVRQDLLNLQTQYSKISLPTSQISSAKDTLQNAPKCTSNLISNLYSGFQTSFTLPSCPASNILNNGGGNTNLGQIISVSNTQTSWEIFDINGKQIKDTSITINPKNLIDGSKAKSDSSSSTNSASATSTKTSKSKAGAAASVSVGSGFMTSVFAFLLTLI